MNLSCPTHCCPVHGCKYAPPTSDTCPVENHKVAPVYPNNNGCEQCVERDDLALASVKSLIEDRDMYRDLYIENSRLVENFVTERTEMEDRVKEIIEKLEDRNWPDDLMPGSKLRRYAFQLRRALKMPNA